MTTTPTIVIDKIASESMRVPIIGTSPLIVHKFSAKAKQAMLDAMQGRKGPKENKNPEQDYESCFYRLPDDRYGFPVLGFKAATVGAARFYGKTLKMTELRQFIFMHGVYSTADQQALVPLEGEPKMREDIVRVGMGTDLRYRPEFREWSAVLHVTYVKSCLSRDSVLSLIDAGGMGVGIGEWRPEKRGEFGTYAIDTNKEVEVDE